MSIITADRFLRLLNCLRTEIIMQALLEQEELDDTSNDDTAPGSKSKDEASLSTIAQPKLRMMRSKWRPSLPKPADARAHSKSEAGQSLFMTEQSHAMLAKETAAVLDAYNKGTPASLQKFYAAKERIAREDASGPGSGGAGSPATPVVPQGQGYDASRDPRLRR